MKNKNCTVLVLALVAVALTAPHTRAQSIYSTPYAFTNFVGLPGTSGTNDGTGSAARFGGVSFGNGPQGVAVDTNGNVYVADTYNHTIRKITPAGVVTTLAGSTRLSGSTDATNGAARFYQPNGVAVDGPGNLYVADTYNYTIRKVTPGGTVTTLAGMAGSFGSADGTNSVARFYFPAGVAVDSAGNVYVADTYNHTLRKLTPVGTNWVVTTLAGLALSPGTNDATGSAARFNQPSSAAVDSAGNVYVTDNASHTVRKITPTGTNWVVTTLAGSAGQIGSVDATGSAARFNDLFGVAVDSAGNVFVADKGNSIIRKITPGAVVTTLAGVVTHTGSSDGSGTNALFFLPFGLAVDNAGKVFVADTYNNRITKGTPPPAPLQFDTSAGNLTVSNGFFHALLTGPSGGTAVVESSANLQAWTPVQTNALPPAGLNLSLPVGTNQKLLFRARLAP